jgi:tagaturonate reductase
VQPIDRGLTDMINQADGLYTTILRGRMDGQTVEETEVIRVGQPLRRSYRDFKDFLACAENPDMRFVISNSTEAGIAYAPGDQGHRRAPPSFPGSSLSSCTAAGSTSRARPTRASS